MLQTARSIRVARSPAEKLDRFKAGVRDAAREYMVARDKDEFVRCLREVSLLAVRGCQS
jgi:hypothetical protein